MIEKTIRRATQFSKQEHPMARKLFLTGEPGAGKTTVLQKVITKLGDDCVGFYAVELRGESGQRIGFNLETVNIPEAGGPLAHVDFTTGLIVGKYQVDPTAMDRIVQCAELFNSNKVLVIDEIGWMQSYSEPYKAFVDKALSDPEQKVLAIIKSASQPWVDAVKEKFDDIRTINVRPDNRDGLANDICLYLLS